MSNKNRYDSYRGREGLGGFLKVIIVLLVIVLLLGIAALIFLQPYMVFSSDGVRIELPPLPFFGEAAPPQESDVPSTPSPTPAVVTPSPTPEPTPTPKPDGLHVAMLDRAALTDGTAAEQAAAAGCNAALFDMKADDGSLGYISSLKLAKNMNASASEPGLNDAIKSLSDSGLYTIARVSCFRDNKLPSYTYNSNPPLGLRSDSGNWRDSDGVRWSNPLKERAADYVADICVELAKLGFDEILLDNAGYPTTGRTNRIKVDEENYIPGRLHEPVEAFYAKVAQALEPYGTKLSIVSTSTAVLEGSDPLSGQRLEALAQYAGRIWLTPEEGTPTDAYRAALEGAGLEDVDQCLVWMGAEGERTESWFLPAPSDSGA